MLARRFPIMLLIVIASLLGATACRPATEGESGEVASSAETATPSETVTPADAVTSSDIMTTSDAAASSEAVKSSEAVTATVQVEDNSEQANPGQSGPGAASEEPQTGSEDEEETVKPGPLIEYVDNTYSFRVSYPDNFVFRTQPADKLAQLMPKPDAAFTIINPVLAASDLGDLEPPDLEIRVYNAAEAASLEEWLTSNGLLAADAAVPLASFETANVSGVEVCASTMIAPGCSYFVMGNGYVYQLIAITPEGEAMVQTFKMTS